MQTIISDTIVGRLPLYLRVLQQMAHEGKLYASSQDLGERLGLTAAQIRKDLSQFGGFGKQGTGYPVEYLLTQLRKILKVDRVWDVALIGVGDVGRALARYNGFTNRGFRVVMVFDNSPDTIGKKVGEFTILGTENMVQTIRDAGIKFAMLSVPASAAQAVTDELVKAGVQAILNYAPINLNVPESVHVQNIDPAIHLQHMSYYQD